MSRKYSQLTVAEQWEWHARVYAFRRVVLSIERGERTSPCDTSGEWFDAALVDEAERRLRHQRASKFANLHRDDSDVWDAREVENKWAQDRGYKNFEHYKAAERIDHVEACKRLILSLPGPKTMPREPGGKAGDQRLVAAALGVRAWEPTAEQLRAGRVALGLERREAAE